MQGFRSVCIIYDKEDAYDACYLKEYFKWIGLSYVDCLYNAGHNIFKNPEKCVFDIVVNINGAMPEEEGKRLKMLLSFWLIEVPIERNKLDSFLVLSNLIQQIEDHFLGEDETCSVLKKLAVCYKEYELVNVLYEYTFVLLENMEEQDYKWAYNKFIKALSDVENILENCRASCYNDKGNKFTEYALYAKYNCQKNINTLLHMQGRILKYDVEEYLNNINEIYEFDEEYYKVEYLKAKMAEQDCLYDGYVKYYLDHCIEQCPVGVCKSFHYYSLAKWREKNEQPTEASEAYRLSYYNNPSNIKAIFKIAVEKTKLEHLELAILFLQEIMDIWNDQDEMEIMPAREIEYAYKVRRQIAELTDRQLRDNYIGMAQSYLQFVENLKNNDNISLHCFMKRMYPSSEQLERICSAMLRRMDRYKLIILN